MSKRRQRQGGKGCEVKKMIEAREGTTLTPGRPKLEERKGGGGGWGRAEVIYSMNGVPERAANEHRKTEIMITAKTIYNLKRVRKKGYSIPSSAPFYRLIPANTISVQSKLNASH